MPHPTRLTAVTLPREAGTLDFTTVRPAAYRDGVPVLPSVTDLPLGVGDCSTRPRLLVLASTYPARGGDGTPAFVSDLARVEATGFDTVVVTPLVSGGLLREEHGGVEVRRYRYFLRPWADLADGAILENLRARPSRWLQVPSFFLAGALAVRRALRDIAPDVIHVHWIIPQGVMALLAARRVPWLVTTLGGDLYALTSGPARWLKGRVLRRARAVTVMNDEMRRIVVGLGVSPEKVQVLPMGVALHRSERRQPAAENESVRLVFVGRLVEKKGVEVLLDALAQMPEAARWTLDIVGDGPLREALEQRAEPLGDRVIFLGQQSASDLAGLLSRRELAIFPSVRARSGDQDGLPVALLEAMAAGTPIVASDLPGIRDAVAGGQQDAPEPPAGVLVKPGDAAALATAIRTLLDEPGSRQRMGLAAARRASEYSIDVIGAQYVRLLKQVATGTSAPNEGERAMLRVTSVANEGARRAAHLLLATRKWSDRVARDVLGDVSGARVLEIGSGRQDLGADAYSLMAMFPDAAEFIQSDVNPAFGHRVVDVTDMAIDREFDVILCMYVLEHVFDVGAAVQNMRDALRPGGKMLIAVPHVYPYHDEPIDFWRFTEHSLRELCRDFSTVDIRRKGMRRFPKALLAIATR